MGASASDDDGHASEAGKRPQAAPDAMEQRPTQPARGAEQATGSSKSQSNLDGGGQSARTAGTVGSSGDETKDVGDLMHVIDLDQFFQTWRSLFPADKQRLLLPLAHAAAKRGEAYFKRFYVPLGQNERDAFNKPAFPDVAQSISIAEQLRKEMNDAQA
jgi:hypothetical protein